MPTVKAENHRAVGVTDIDTAKGELEKIGQIAWM